MSGVPHPPDGYREDVRADLLADLRRTAGPKVIFHYASAEAFYGILKSGAFWLSNVGYLNDPNELTYATRIVDEALKSRYKELTGALAGAPEDKNSPEAVFLRDLHRAIQREELWSQWYVGSFSLVADDLSQWRAYCPKGGYAIGFDANAIARTVSDRNDWWRVCGLIEYDESKQKMRIGEIADRYAAQFLRLKSKYPSVDTLAEDLQGECENEIFAEILFWKHSAFAAEQEWRVAGFPILPGAVKFRAGWGGLLVPYADFPFSDKERRLPLQSVFVCPLGHPALAKHSAKLLLESLRYDDSIVHESRYGLR